ncbi:DUF883 domain-containing protein [Pseudoalteromonas sp. SSMSWG5]|uniref:DUF883 C-terminal domain-containing protein n=1 Tax=Pseudoalteromonas TaxID=53246 RepID=UPI000C550C9A|nr:MULTISPECIES: DUF883 C-terminal domain-containing protein [unclassified Pseudoalteromonas]MBD57020.1 DUF883 domain-containing protein [Pseudoalteromonas sp.]MBU75988.1 DUF883 domain-containing protein [Pseudoalteromonadaceae bacterium]MCF2900139.1 DUF883 C-terminal domain-containing protein [Pseudoalteromonas sp. OFAV1]MCF2919573.1 DUF883 C-terminal domain-containing protein [Pseudoalteromonas sp. APAL1]MCO7251552.1 DUF883 C-terminal domain-containing protein [Pseudoalteromonas sp. Ps84H-4]
MATATSKSNSSTANSKTNPKPTEVEAPFTEKATEAAHHAVDALSTRAASAEHSVREGASNSAQTISEKQAQAREKLGEYSSKTRQLASENPLATAGIAFAAGMLVSALIRRK